jgi:hypothetical protein
MTKAENDGSEGIINRSLSGLQEMSNNIVDVRVLVMLNTAIIKEKQG